MQVVSLFLIIHNMLRVQVVAGWKYHIVLHLGITTEPACLGAATQKIVKIANCPGADLVGPIFYLTISLLRLFQQHYRQYGTGQSQESEGSYKPRGSRKYQVHTKLHSLQASL